MPRARRLGTRWMRIKRKNARRLIGAVVFAGLAGWAGGEGNRDGIHCRRGRERDFQKQRAASSSILYYEKNPPKRLELMILSFFAATSLAAPDCSAVVAHTSFPPFTPPPNTGCAVLISDIIHGGGPITYHTPPLVLKPAVYGYLRSPPHTLAHTHTQIQSL